jgi:type II secretory pathway component GspD/PulD (secretin)
MIKPKTSLIFLLIFCIFNLALAQENGEEFIPEEEPAAEEAQPAQPTQAQKAPAQQPPAEVSLIKSGNHKISLDIKGMDVVDVLKMLAQRSGMNMVVGKNVTGRVTLFIKDVDINDAFEIIILANDLAYEKKGGIINVMTQRDYELIYGERFQDKKQAKVMKLRYAKAADLSRALVQIKTNVGRIVVDEGTNTLAIIDTPQKVAEMEDFIAKTDIPIQTRVFNLNYGQADKLQPKIQEALTKGVGVIRIDERTNKIAVTDYPEKLDEIAKVIAAFDEKTPQVLIDAQIIEIKPSDKFEMGVDWEFWIRNHFKLAEALPMGTTGRLLIGTIGATDPAKKGEYTTVVDMLRTIGDAKILSSPRIMVLNNQEAKIHVGTKDAYITSTTSQAGTGTAITSQAVNFVDTGIQLAVTPTINRDGFVTMKLKPEVSSATRTDIKSEGQITQIPIVTTSEAETTIMLKDGVTLIIGGLKKEERTKETKRIPILGSIPLLGYLFGSTSDEAKKSELVILLTPHIMTGETSFSDFSEIKPVDGARARMDKGNINIERTFPDGTAIAGYDSQVADKIRWLASVDKPKSQTGEVKLSFVLSRSGSLIGEPSVIEASNSALIPYAVKAIKSSAPFGSFPKKFNKEQETFKISLFYE